MNTMEFFFEIPVEAFFYIHVSYFSSVYDIQCVGVDVSYYVKITIENYECIIKRTDNCSVIPIHNNSMLLSHLCHENCRPCS